MEPQIDFLSVAYILGAVQGLFLSLALWQKRPTHYLANRLLAIFLLSFSLLLLNTFYEHSRYYLLLPHLFVIVMPILFLFGPLMYLYIRTITQGLNSRIGKKNWLHFLPFVIAYILLIPVYLLSAEQKIVIEATGDLNPQNLHQLLVVVSAIILNVASIFHIGIYLILSLLLLHAHSKNIKQRFSYTDKINLNWLRNLLIACFFLWLLHISEILFGDSLSFNLSEVTDFIIVIIIYLMGYLGFRQPVIFSSSDSLMQRQPNAPDRAETATHAKEKYEKSGLDQNAGKAILQSLQHHMQQNQPYRDNTLSITILAQQLGISVHYLSQVINEHLNMNFFDFINRHRIEEAKRQLMVTDGSSANILQLAMDVGFNSKSAFYTAFKKHLNTTPTQFRKHWADQAKISP